MGRKTHNRDKEYDEMQRIKQENKKLREQIGKLRKVIKNIDIEQYNFVQDLLNSETFEEDNTQKIAQKKLEKKWECFTCGKGVMRLITLNRAGEPYYMRKCDKCDNRTKLKKYTNDVEGA